MSNHEHIGNPNPDQPYRKVEFLTRAVAEGIAEGAIDPSSFATAGERVSSLPPMLRKVIQETLEGNIPPLNDIVRAALDELATTDFNTDPDYLLFLEYMRQGRDANSNNNPSPPEASP